MKLSNAVTNRIRGYPDPSTVGDPALNQALQQALLRRTDSTTGLPNRVGLEEALGSGQHLGTPDRQCALVEVRLPHHGLLCAAFGGEHIRPLLRMLGEFLQATAGQQGIAARIADDAFLLVLPGLVDAAEAHGRCAELQAAIGALRMPGRAGLRIWTELRLGYLPPDEPVPLAVALTALHDVLPLALPGAVPASHSTDP